jgi:excisionase family DNA binding protein
VTAEQARAALESADLTHGAEVLAAVLKIPKNTVYELARTGRCPVEPIRCGRSIRFRATDLRTLAGL